MSAAGTRWGFHELRDSSARSLVDLAGIGSGDLVVDLGAGTGSLTRHLLRAGARVIAVEMHAGRAATLRQRVGDQSCRIIQVDLANFVFPAHPFRVVANPPFAMLAMILRRLTAPRSRLVRADLVVPSHVAARWTRGAHPSVRRYEATTARRLRRTEFSPPATQPVAILSLTRRIVGG